MKKRNPLILFMCTLLAATTCTAQLPVQLTSRLDVVMDSLCQRYRLKGAVAAVHFPGAGTWKRAWGYSNATTPVTPEMYMGIGSNTKTFIAAVLLRLQEKNLLNLDDSIGKWIQGYPNINGQATIRQCLNHSSGINDYLSNEAVNDSVFGNPSKRWTKSEILHLAQSPLFAPGTSWSYSNTNYIIAGIIIESVTNKSAWQVIKEEILQPQSLQFTGNFGDAGISPIAHPWSSALTGNVMEDMTQTPYLNNLFSLATTAGSMMSTAEDNALFWHKLFSGQILTPASWSQMVQTINIGGGAGYGLGIFRYISLFSGRVAYSHGGTFFGYINENAVDASSGISFSILTNQDSISNNVLMAAFLRAMHRVTLLNPVSVKEKLTLQNIHVYPNPTAGKITIQNNSHVTLSAVEWYDITGRLKYQTTIQSDNSVMETSAQLTPGIYLVRLVDEQRNIVHQQKLTIQ